jgi:hypothetical protein
MKATYRSLELCLLLVACQASLTAATFSFAGSFVQDNDLQLFTFNLGAPGTVTLRTFGYGGGLNGSGQTIPAGGFVPVLGLFDSAGIAQTGALQAGHTPCPPLNPDPARNNLCLDVFAQVNLAAGNYIVSLTQSPNDPLGNLSDGFFFRDAIPDPNFNNGFFDANNNFQGKGNWALDIIGVNTASQVGGVPEPATGLLAAAAVLIAAAGQRTLRRP